VSDANKSPQMPAVLMQPQEWELVDAILRKHIPEHSVWAYGSRSRGARARGESVKRFSDLDLAVDGPKLNAEQRYGLEEDFDECALPYKVSVSEMVMMDDGFRKRIERDLVLVRGKGATTDCTDKHGQGQILNSDLR